MSNIITRSTGSNPKGAPLTAGELDSNFINLNADKVESTRAINTTAGDLTGGGDLSGDRTLGLASTGISAGTVQNSATQVTPLTLDIKGRVTAVGTPVTITPDFSNVANKPTTLSGYGITDAQATITGAATTIDTEDLTASKVLVSNASGKVAASDISTTTLGYLDATSSVQGQLDSKQATTAKNAANGYAGLDANAKLPTSLLPALAISEYLGSVANQTARLALTGEKGDWCSQADNGKVYVITGDDPTSDASWTALTYPVTPGITLNGTSIDPGDTATITAATTNTLTIGTGLSGTSFNGSSATTIAIDSSVVTLTGEQTLTSKTLTSPTINGGTGAFTTLSSTGNTTIGDASGDTLTINGTAVACPNNLNFDSNTLFIDAASNAVGIGTSSSSGKLTVSGVSSSNVASFLSSASGTFSAISIGRTANEFSLGTVAAGNQFFSGTAAGDSAIAYGAGKLFVGGGNTGSSGTLSTVFDASGNVGIGTSSPVLGKLNVTTGYAATDTTARPVAFFSSTDSSVPGSSPSGFYVQYTGNATATNRLVELNSVTLGSGSYGAMRLNNSISILSSGNVGIGEPTPQQKLDVVGGTIGSRGGSAGAQAAVWAQQNDFYSTPTYKGTSIYTWGSTATGTDANITRVNLGSLYFQNLSNALIWSNTPIPLIFATNAGTETMRLTAAGRLGIGDTSPSYKLDVTCGDGDGLRINSSVNGIINFAQNGTTISQIVGQHSGAPELTLKAGRGMVLYTGGIASPTGFAMLGPNGGLNIGYSALNMYSIPANGMVCSGNVGIGTSSPSGYMLNVNGSVLCCGASPQSSYTFNANGQGIFKTTTNWNYSGLDLVRNSSNTSTPRHLGFLLDGDSSGSTTIGSYPAIWGIYSGAPTTGSTSSGLSAKMGLASYAGFNYYINGTQAMTLDASGNLLVGNTVNDSSRLSVEATTAGYAIRFRRNTTTYGTSAIVGGISCDGSSTVYSTSSDQRLKTNITSSGSAAQSILDFPVDQFDWISDGSHVDFGAVAQKAINVIPEMVSVPEDPEEMWGIDWSKAVPRLIRAYQELHAEIELLKAKVN